MSSPQPIHFIDGHWADASIQLHQAKEEHPELVGGIWKASQGTQFSDPTFRKMKERFVSVGLSFSAYCFIEPGAEGTALDQWWHFNDCVESRQGLLMIGADVEENPKYSPWDSMNDDHRSCIFQTESWLRLALDTGHLCFLYGDKDYYRTVFPRLAADVWNHPQLVKWVSGGGAYGEPEMEWDLWQWTGASAWEVGGQAMDCSCVNPTSKFADVLLGKEQK